MNFVVICLHCLDMRDFHSLMRNTPILDSLRERAIFVPMGRSQAHNQFDSLNAEMTGWWSARLSDSTLTENGYAGPKKFWYPKTLLEYLRENGYVLHPCFRGPASENMGTAAYSGLKRSWLVNEPQRVEIFHESQPRSLEELIDGLHDSASGRFYAHLFLRHTHRPWDQPEGLGALLGEAEPPGWPEDAFCARRAALERPAEFAALRRRGLARADAIVGRIMEATADISDVCYLIYSNHGEVFDHFRPVLPYHNDGSVMVEGTSHGPYPYEVLYANMQMWLIPGMSARVMRGIGRTIDIPATILELAGIERGFMDGRSMLDAFGRGRFPATDRYAETGRGNGLGMVRCDGMKVISTGKRIIDAQRKLFGPEHHRLAVFDLHTDPHEYVNLIDTDHGREALHWAIRTHAGLKAPPERGDTPGRGALDCRL